jgi:hypothetical protein
MLKSISSLTGATILGKDAQKKISGGTVTCGFREWDEWNGGYIWVPAPDANGNGATKDDARKLAAAVGAGWCCNSCPWN